MSFKGKTPVDKQDSSRRIHPFRLIAVIVTASVLVYLMIFDALGAGQAAVEGLRSGRILRGIVWMPAFLATPLLAVYGFNYARDVDGDLVLAWFWCVALLVALPIAVSVVMVGQGF